MKIPLPIRRVIDSFEQLPGIGPKTASRLAFYLLRFPQPKLEEFADAIFRLKKDTQICSICYNIDNTDPCSICSDQSRNRAQICVVEKPLDILAIEKSGFSGLYHCLGGLISPLNNIGPNQLFIRQLIERVKNPEVKEIIIATNPTMEGEATAMYIAQLIRQQRKADNLRISRLGQGIPSGADLEYADSLTLKKAFEGRTPFNS